MRTVQPRPPASVDEPPNPPCPHSWSPASKRTTCSFLISPLSRTPPTHIPSMWLIVSEKCDSVWLQPRRQSFHFSVCTQSMFPTPVPVHTELSIIHHRNSCAGGFFTLFTVVETSGTHSEGHWLLREQTEENEGQYVSSVFSKHTGRSRRWTVHLNLTLCFSEQRVMMLFLGISPQCFCHHWDHIQFPHLHQFLFQALVLLQRIVLLLLDISVTTASFCCLSVTTLSGW